VWSAGFPHHCIGDFFLDIVDGHRIDAHTGKP
jgi:hypothetical protein